MSVFNSLILVGLSLGQTPQPVKPFSDVPKTHWAYAAVTELHERGILQGYPVYYDRSTPHAALQSLVKAIHNDDDAMIQELTSSEWRSVLEARYPDARERGVWMRGASESWLNAKLYSNQDWKSFNAKAQKAPLGQEVVFVVRHLWFLFVREPAGWTIKYLQEN